LSQEISAPGLKNENSGTVGLTEFHISPEWAGKRLDAVAALLFPQFSRGRLQSWLADGYLTVNGELGKKKSKVLGGELLSLPVIYEDEHILIINKPAGLVMHPAPGNRQGTLMNGLLHRHSSLYGVPRAGIVHRLDKETSGLCVVARTLESHTHLVRQLQAREMGRRYTAIVVGDVPINGTVNAPIGRHPRDRKRMSVNEHGKEAITHFECRERFLGCALVSVKLETGRTHQIRVHMTHIGHALIGDPVYGRRLAVLPRQVADVPAVANFKRQALHAHQLELIHPGSDETMTFDSPMPDDMIALASELRDVAEEALRLEAKNDH